jgi:hypothetical protein
MKPAWFCAVSSIALVVIAQSALFADAVLTVVPPSAPVTVGETFTVAIDVTGPTIIHDGQSLPSGVSDLASFQI